MPWRDARVLVKQGENEKFQPLEEVPTIGK